eukprot:461460_1
MTTNNKTEIELAEYIDKNKAMNKLLSDIGMNNVLISILSSNDLQLTNDQLSQISRINASETKSSTGIITNEIEEIHDNETPPEWTYTFSKNDTYLHSFFGDNRGQKIFHIATSKCIGKIVTIAIVFNFFIMLSLDHISGNIALVAESIAAIVWIIIIGWSIMVLLSMNRHCFKLLSKSFEYWLKIYFTL